MVNSEEFWWILLFISVKIIMERWVFVILLRKNEILVPMLSGNLKTVKKRNQWVMLYNFLAVYFFLKNKNLQIQ
jgi:hypothetical protein